MSHPKELDFFIDPAETLVPSGNWPRGVAWYESHFRSDAAIRGEASPNYTVYPFTRGVPERAASLVPGARIVYMVRDPIDRIVSQYLHRFGEGKERRSLDEALADIGRAEPAMSLVYRSMYFMQLERWLACFPARNVLVVAQEELLGNRVETLRRVFAFLGIDETFHHERFAALSNVSREKRAPTRLEAWLRQRRAASTARRLPRVVRAPGRRVLNALNRDPLHRPVLSEARRDELRTLLQEDTDRLRAYTGRSFSSWSL